MGFKDWPYWLKGGIVGIILEVILIIGGFILDLITKPEFYSYTLVVVVAPLILLTNLIESFGVDFSFIAIFLGIPAYFILGVIIGLIVGKIKSKKQQ